MAPTSRWSVGSGVAAPASATRLEDVVGIRRQPIPGGLARARPPDRPRARSAGARRARERLGPRSLRSRSTSGRRVRVGRSASAATAARRTGQRLVRIEREAGDDVEHRRTRAAPSSSVRATPRPAMRTSGSAIAQRREHRRDRARHPGSPRAPGAPRFALRTGSRRRAAAGCAGAPGRRSHAAARSRFRGGGRRRGRPTRGRTRAVACRWPPTAG